MRLSELGMGQTAVIEALDFDLRVARRLESMGFMKGNVICPVGKGPLGDPQIYAILNSRFALRKVDAGKIIVAKKAETCPPLL